MPLDSKGINKEIMQLKTFNRAGKEIFLLLSFIVSRNLGLIIFPSGHRIFHKWSFYVLPVPPTNTQTHNFIIVVLKRLYYLFTYHKMFWVLKVALQFISWRLVAYEPVAVKVLVFMRTQLTNRTINVRTRIEKDKIVVLFASFAFFTCFSSNLMKNVTKKCKTVQYLYINDLLYVSQCNTVDIYQISIKGTEATCVEIATEMKKFFRLKDMLNFNIPWNF